MDWKAILIGVIAFTVIMLCNGFADLIDKF